VDFAGSGVDVTENPKELADEAQRGRSERTPALALTGVKVAVSAVVIVIMLAALLVYYLVQ
jgi:hypothetical protein